MTGRTEGHVPSLARSAVYTPAVALAGAIGPGDRPEGRETKSVVTGFS